MPNLKSLRSRINSVGSTRKITRAMQMVAASKLRRAQETIFAARPYAQNMHQTIAALATQTPMGQLSPLARSFFDEKTERTKHLFIVMTTERGLCGGFNTQILRLLRNSAARIRGQGGGGGGGGALAILCVGKKAREGLRRDWGSEIIQTFPANLPPLDLARDIAEAVLERFKSGESDCCTIFYSRFISVLEQEPRAHQLIPVSHEALTASASALHSVYSYEPDEAQMLDKLLPSHLAAQLLRGLLENEAGEQGARMTAMDSATRNADDMIDALSLVYNRTRQAAITKELVEIISGAEAL